jgi:Uma2 family endonuclease
MLQTRSTVEEFEYFVDLPENADKLFEYIRGEIIEVPSRPYASSLAAHITIKIMTFTEEHKLGFITGKGGSYIVSGERYAPDVGFISKTREPKLPMRGYPRNPPDLAIEIDAPDDFQFQRNIRTKIANYLAAGTLVWVVLPETKEVEVYEPGQPKKLVGIDGVLNGGDVLSGFTLAIKDIFPD